MTLRIYWGTFFDGLLLLPLLQHRLILIEIGFYLLNNRHHCRSWSLRFFPHFKQLFDHNRRENISPILSVLFLCPSFFAAGINCLKNINVKGKARPKQIQYLLPSLLIISSRGRIFFSYATDEASMRLRLRRRRREWRKNMQIKLQNKTDRIRNEVRDFNSYFIHVSLWILNTHTQYGAAFYWEIHLFNILANVAALSETQTQQTTASFCRLSVGMPHQTDASSQNTKLISEATARQGEPWINRRFPVWRTHTQTRPKLRSQDLMPRNSKRWHGGGWFLNGDGLK